MKRKHNEESNKYCQFYYIKRLNDSNSTIMELPKSLKCYKSEYIYLFSEINKFKSAGCPEDKSYMIPNVIRRFLEMYTLIKLPGNRGEVDERLSILAKGELELKVLHHFSHMTSFDRVLSHEPLIFKMNDVVDELFQLLSKDPSHLLSLQEGIASD